MALGVQQYVDYRSSLSFVGRVLTYLSAAPAFPAVLALYYGDDPVPFLVTIAVMFLLGRALGRLEPEPDLGQREAFLMVSLTWLVVPVVGAVPYLVAGQGTVAHPVNALFESMSGFTTTGATVLGEISTEQHSRSMLMWRQFTQWLGGMGIVVLMVAILPELSVGGAQLIKEEAPGITVDKLTPRIQETARILWKIYLGFTVAAAVAYYGLHLAGLAPNMDLYNAVAHALTTLPTGGFSPEARSIEAFSPAVQWMVVPFMVIAGTNFALWWYVVTGSPRELTRNPEFRTYLAAMAGVAGLVAALLYTGVGLAQTPSNIGLLAGDVEHSLRQGVFQAVAIVTTTGYASMDFNTWDQSAQTVLLVAMFLGGSAGSAAGSIKIIRWHIVRETTLSELFGAVHPDAVSPVRLAEEIIDEETIRGVFVFVLLFLVIFAASTVVVFVEGIYSGLGLSTIEAASVAIATLGNVGPGFGVIGPMDSYLPFSDPAKLYLVFLMWIGRLEIISVLVIFTPSFWTR